MIRCPVPSAEKTEDDSSKMVLPPPHPHPSQFILLFCCWGVGGISTCVCVGGVGWDKYMCVLGGGVG